MFCYNSIQLYDTKFNKNRQTNFREYLIVARVWAGGTRATLLGGAFRFAKYEKLRRRKKKRRKRGRAKIPSPPTPFLFARPSNWILKFGIRIFVKKSSDFNQKAPQFFRIRILGDYCLAPPKAGLGFGEDLKSIFEIAKERAVSNAEVHRAKLWQNEILQPNLFSFAFGERQSDNLILTAQII